MTLRAPNEIRSAEASGRPARKLRAALIGTGAIAREHLAALAGLPDVEVGGVCDLSATRAESTAERFGVARWFSDHRRMLADVAPDVVHITTPPPTHFRLARECLEAGLHVLCEKPITVEYEEFLALRRLATERGRLLVENQNCRFNATVLRIQALIESGELGSVVDVQVQICLNIGAKGSRFVDPHAPHPCLSMRGGAIADFLTHLGYLAFIFAGAPRSVRTIWSKRVTDSPLPSDEFRALMQCERATALVSFSANAQPNGFWVRVAGTRMHAETNLFDPPRLTLRRARPGVAAVATCIDGVIESRDLLEGTLRGLWRKLGGTSSYDGLAELVARTYVAVARGGPSPVPIDEIELVARLVRDFTSPERAS